MLQAQGQLSHSHPIQGEPSWAWTQAGWPLNPPLLTSIVLSIGFTEPVRPTIQARAHTSIQGRESARHVRTFTRKTQLPRPLLRRERTYGCTQAGYSVCKQKQIVEDERGETQAHCY